MKVTISCSVCSETNFIQLQKAVVTEQGFEGLLASCGHRDENCILVADLYSDSNELLHTKVKTTEPPPEEEAPPEDPAKPWWQFW